MRKSFYILFLLVLLPLVLLSQNRGIDVSKYQGAINWKKVAATKKVAFVYVKATEGTTIQDPNYKANIKGARDAGIPVGSYHLYSSKTTAYQQFENFKSVVKKDDQDLIPVLDIEAYHSKGLNMERVDKLLELMEKEYGAKPMIYTSEKVVEDHFNVKKYKDYPIFIANYHYFPKFRFTLWQFSESERVNGIQGNVDMSEFNQNASIDDILLPEK